MLVHRFCFSRIRVHGTGGGGWGHPQGDMHMVAARLGCESHGRVGHSSPDCIDRLTNTTLTLQGVDFWQGTLNSWTLSGTWWLLGLAVCERAMVGTRWATSHHDCNDRIQKTLGGWVFSQGRLLGSERVHDNPERQDYGMLVNEWAWLSLDGHEFVVRAWTEMEHAWLQSRAQTPFGKIGSGHETNMVTAYAKKASSEELMVKQ